MLISHLVPLRPCFPSKFVPAIRRFSREDTGSITIFTLFIFCTIILITGMAMDLMRFETRRVAFQGTLDAAVLAAADMEQGQTAEKVVQEYMDATGLEGISFKTWEDKGLNYRTVAAMGGLQTNTYFMRLMGIHSMDVPATGGAYEGKTDVEISLVMDVSGSMGSNSRLVNAKTAAIEFVNTVISTEPESSDQTHITIVPFSTQVNMGADLASHFTLSGEHNNSFCVDWQQDDFLTPAVSLTDTLRQTGHFDPRRRRLASEDALWLVCDTAANRQILPFENNITTLETFINALDASGYTSLDLGAKWGAAFLDPSTRPIAEQMASDGDIASAFDVRPMDYRTRNMMKVMILMSDGEQTDQWWLNDDFQSGPSNLYYHAASKTWTWHDEENEFTSSTTDKFWYENASGNDTWASEPYAGDESIQLTWPQVWEMASVDWIREYIVEDMTNSSATSQTWEDKVFTHIDDQNDFDLDGVGVKDAKARDLCTSAKAEGVTIYAIGFETDAAGDEALKLCATSIAHFFNAQGTQISDVFASIAADITQLKLTH